MPLIPLAVMGQHRHLTKIDRPQRMARGVEDTRTVTKVTSLSVDDSSENRSSQGGVS